MGKPNYIYIIIYIIFWWIFQQAICLITREFFLRTKATNNQGLPLMFEQHQCESPARTLACPPAHDVNMDDQE